MPTLSPSTNNPRLAVIIPMYNEAANIAALLERLSATLAEAKIEAIAILVDDGSTDDSVALAAAHLSQLPGSQLVELSRNFGKEAALLAGMDTALATNFDAAVLLDADLQHPPEAIPELIAGWRNGNDMVIAARASRHGDRWPRRLLTRCFYRAMNRLADIPIIDGDGDFRLMGRRVVEAICSLREHDRFTKGLYSWVGFRQQRIVIEFGGRADGESKFKLARLFALAIDAATSFSAKPLRVAIYAGVAIGLCAILYGIELAVQTLVFGNRVPGYASIFSGMMFLGGIQLVAIGLLGEYVARAYMQTKSRPCYIARRVIKADEQITLR